MITNDELRLLCDLSRLYLSDEELCEYGKEMSDIMDLMDTIGESSFEYNPIDMTNAVNFSELRADEVITYENVDGIVAIGPEVRENQFIVPKIVD